MISRASFILRSSSCRLVANSLPTRSAVSAMRDFRLTRTARLLRVGIELTDAFSVEIDRRILVFDRPEGELKQLALDLIGRDFEVHYANDIDEAQILARETKGRINAVVLSTDAGIERIADIAQRFGVSPAALIPIGPRPADRVVAALHFHGVRWQLWDDPPDESIRFVISRVLFEQDPFEIRYHSRVPTSLAARLEVNGVKCDTSIRDISLGGACLLGGVVGNEGDQGSLDFSCGDDEISLPVRIAWTIGDAADALNVSGVSFLEVTPDAGEVLDRLLESVFARRRIEKPL